MGANASLIMPGACASPTIKPRPLTLPIVRVCVVRLCCIREFRCARAVILDRISKSEMVNAVKTTFLVFIFSPFIDLFAGEGFRRWQAVAH